MQSIVDISLATIIKDNYLKKNDNTKYKKKNAISVVV